MVISTSLKILHLLLDRQYINHIHLFNFFYLPPLLCSLPLVWHVFHTIAVFVLVLYFTEEREHAAFGLLKLANFI
jgi:hypothetical protein